jgi:hypothetical protein
MIYLITGLPGNGKTLYALWHVKERAERENRPVFYSGIYDLAISDWQEMDNPAQWYDLPAGSIIVIDEAQSVFRPRPGRGEPPLHVSKLETHRHNGHDLYLITQHPALIDQNVRRLAGIHRHIVRTFGLSRAVIHEWGEVHLDCERRRADSSKTNWNYPRNVYSLYKSAEVHTHRRHFPKQVWYLGACLLALCAFVYYFWNRVHQVTDTEMALAATATATEAKVGEGDVFPVRDSQEKRPMTREEYIASLQPRIEGLPHTAPRYDELTAPTDAPYPVGCYTVKQSSDAYTCKCVTQQGTPFRATPEFCLGVVRNGFFKDWGNHPAVDQPSAPDRGPLVGPS